MIDESLLTIDRQLRSLLPTGVGLRFAPGVGNTASGAARLVGTQKRQQELRAGRVCAVQALWDVGWRSDLESLNSPDAITAASPDLLMQVIAVGHDRAPIWPAGFVGSISHSANWTWAVAAPQSKLLSIGVDTEAIVGMDTHDVVRQEVASPSEWSLLNAHSLRSELETTLMFSVKEAYFKLWYPLVHQFYNFEDVVVLDVSSSQQRPSNLADGSHLSFGIRTNSVAHNPLIPDPSPPQGRREQRIEMGSKSDSADLRIRIDQSSVTRVNVVWTKTDVFSAAWLPPRGD